jgi:hypothetical protein
MGTFKCTCGFDYIRVGPDTAEGDRFRLDSVQSYGQEWEKVLRKHWNNTGITVQMIAEKLGVSHLTITRHAIRLKLPMNTPGARAVSNNLIERYKNPRKTVSEALQLYRSKWLAVLEANPNASRQQLMDAAIFLYLWLRKNDSEWIETHLPPANKFIRRGSLHNWGDIDVSFSKTVESAIERIRDTLGPPVRVSITALIREVGHQSWLERHLEKLPLTAKVLSSKLESLETFAIRRVEWAKNHFSQESICPTRHKFIVKANLRNGMGKTLQVQRAITAAIEKLRKQFI